MTLIKMPKKNKKTLNIDRKYVTILGIKVLSTQRERLLTSLKELITHSIKNPNLRLKTRVVTPNPELVLMSLDNSKLKEALNTADFSIPDGIGLAQAAAYNDIGLPKNKVFKAVYGFVAGLLLGFASLVYQKSVLTKLNIIKGRELFLDLVALASKNKWRVYLLGGEGMEAELSEATLKTKFKNLKIMSSKGPMLNVDATPVSKTDIKIQIDTIKRINEFNPNLLFVAFKNPKQELWAKENLPKLNTNLIMCVGGTFRYIGGVKSLPPKWMEKIGFEWVWRLLTEPSRLSRILNAFPVFPYKVFIHKLNS